MHKASSAESPLRSFKESSSRSMSRHFNSERAICSLAVASALEKVWLRSCHCVLCVSACRPTKGDTPWLGLQAIICAHLLSERQIRVGTAHGHPARDGAGVRLQDQPAEAATLSNPGYIKKQARRCGVGGLKCTYRERAARTRHPRSRPWPAAPGPDSPAPFSSPQPLWTHANQRKLCAERRIRTQNQRVVYAAWCLCTL